MQAKAAEVSLIGAKQDVSTKALQDLETTGNTAQYADTLKKLGIPLPVGSEGGAAGAVPPVVMNNWQNAIDTGIGAYPNDSQMKQFAATMAQAKTDPTKANPTALATLARQATLRKTALDAIQESKTKQEAAAAGSSVAKLSTPEALAAPGSQAAIQAKIDDSSTDAADVPRLRALLPQAAVAQFNAENIKAREARNQQVVNQGDPDAAGKLLANRSLTLDELKSRQVTPAFIEAATAAAQKYDPSFKAAESAGQAKIAAAPANQQFFGNTDSLLVRGGTLDQLETAGSNLGNGQFPVINTLENARKTALGSGPQAAYAAAALGVADDYSKVMTGGQGSDTSRQQALDIINKNLSPEGRKAAIAQIHQAVESQRNGRVGQNPYLKDMYPDPSLTRQVAPEGHQVNLQGGGTATKKGGKWIDDKTGQEVK